MSALAEKLVGRQYSLAEPYEVSREKIREFATAIGGEHVDGQLGETQAVFAPPTFTIIVTMKVVERMLADPDLGIDLRHVVHGDQRFSVHRPVVAGDVLSCALSVESVRSMAGSAIVSTRSEVTAHGEPVVTASATLVLREPS